MPLPKESDPIEVRRAPHGKLRMCYIDPRDGWPAPEVDVDSQDEARRVLADMWGPKAANIVVYDEHSEAVELYH
jgi:hypothetical protein